MILGSEATGPTGCSAQAAPGAWATCAAPTRASAASARRRRRPPVAAPAAARAPASTAAGAAAAALATSTASVSGNGTYRSDPFSASALGTYRWVASYAGDPGNAPAAGACGDPAESVTVTAAPPPTTPTCAVTAIRLPGPSGSAE